MIKRSLALLLAVFLLLSLAACGKKNTDPAPSDLPPADTATQIRIGAMTGPTALGFLQMMDASAKQGDSSARSFTLAGTADELVPKLVRGELDMAAVPANLASVLYQNTDGAVCVLAVNTLGVLSIVARGEHGIADISDLQGKTIYATGKGTVPEYTLRHLLRTNGLNPDTDVTIDFRSEPTEVLALLQNDPTAVAMLPQPFVTSALMKLSDLQIALDLTEIWAATQPDSVAITGVLVARREFVEANPEAVAAFLGDYNASIDFAMNNTQEASVLSEEFGIIKADIALKALPLCNLQYIDGRAMQDALAVYLEVLYAQNPASVGGALPDDAFYFIG